MSMTTSERIELLQEVNPPLTFPFEEFCKEAFGANWRNELVKYAVPLESPVGVVDLCRAMYNAGRVSASKAEAMERMKKGER